MVHFRTDSHAVRVGLRIRVPAGPVGRRRRTACKGNAAAGTERDAAGRGPAPAPPPSRCCNLKALWVALEPNSLKGTLFFGSLLASNGSATGAIRLSVTLVCPRLMF